MFATTIAALAASLLVGLPAPQVPAVSADPSADIKVGLTIRPPLVLNLAWVDLMVKNYGPDAADSATVVVTIDPASSWANIPENCTADNVAGTLTCSYGPFIAGAHTELYPTFYLPYIPSGTGHFTATATKTASIPGDPFTNDDSVTMACSYMRSPYPNYMVWCT